MKYEKRHIGNVLKDEGYGNMKYDMQSEYVCAAKVRIKSIS